MSKPVEYSTVYIRRADLGTKMRTERSLGTGWHLFVEIRESKKVY